MFKFNNVLVKRNFRNTEGLLIVASMRIVQVEFDVELFGLNLMLS